MSYREYEVNGKLVRRRYPGHHFTDDQEYYNPDSMHYQNLMEQARGELAEVLGDDYPLWAEMTFPGESINDLTWKEVWLKMRAALSVGAAALFAMLECTCCPDGSYTCPVCQARARMGGE